jgi:hypothetical protein
LSSKVVTRCNALITNQAHPLEASPLVVWDLNPAPLGKFAHVGCVARLVVRFSVLVDPAKHPTHAMILVHVGTGEAHEPRVAMLETLLGRKVEGCHLASAELVLPPGYPDRVASLASRGVRPTEGTGQSQGGGRARAAVCVTSTSSQLKPKRRTRSRASLPTLLRSAWG